MRRMRGDLHRATLPLARAVVNEETGKDGQDARGSLPRHSALGACCGQRRGGQGCAGCAGIFAAPLCPWRVLWSAKRRAGMGRMRGDLRRATLPLARAVVNEEAGRDGQDARGSSPRHSVLGACCGERRGGQGWAGCAGIFAAPLCPWRVLWSAKRRAGMRRMRGDLRRATLPLARAVVNEEAGRDGQDARGSLPRHSVLGACCGERRGGQGWAGCAGIFAAPLCPWRVLWSTRRQARMRRMRGDLCPTNIPAINHTIESP